jgi:hypothetical protein
MYAVAYSTTSLQVKLKQQVTLFLQIKNNATFQPAPDQLFTAIFYKVTLNSMLVKA